MDIQVKGVATFAVGLVAALGAECSTAMGSFGTAESQPYEYCWIDQIEYSVGKYVANGKCQEVNKRGKDQPAGVPWSAVGTYDPSTHETTEDLRIVHGGLDVPTHAYYGTILSKMVCGQDPWLNKVQDCGIERVTTTETIPQYFVDSLVRNRRRPFTSDMKPEQRAAVQREVQAHVDREHQLLTAPVRLASDAARVRNVPPVAAPALVTSGAAQRPQSSVAVQSQPVDIVEPAAGSQQARGNVRVRVRGGASAVDPNMTMIVEVSSLPPRPAQPGAAPSPSPKASRTTQVPLAQLQQGVVLPREITDGWTGPTLVRVRAAQSNAWSNGVSFDLVGSTQGAAARAALPAWSAVQSPPVQSPTARSAIIAPAQGPSMPQVPRSALGGGQ